nr:DUF234 domain-containing protein [Halobaculum sp. XH14]
MNPHPSRIRIRWQSSKPVSVSFETVPRISPRASVRIHRSTTRLVRYDYVATTSADVCTEEVWEAVRQSEFDPYSAVGRWWFGGDEIDIVGLGDGFVLRGLGVSWFVAHGIRSPRFGTGRPGREAP